MFEEYLYERWSLAGLIGNTFAIFQLIFWIFNFFGSSLHLHDAKRLNEGRFYIVRPGSPLENSCSYIQCANQSDSPNRNDLNKNAAISHVHIDTFPQARMEGYILHSRLCL